MFSALILGTIIVIVVTAIIGISPIGELAFQESATMGWANATVWNTYASMGSSITLLIVVPIILLALFLLVALTKTES